MLSKLGKYSIGKSCLYIKKLSDVDQEVLFDLVQQSDEFMKNKYPPKGDWCEIEEKNKKKLFDERCFNIDPGPISGL